MFFTEIKLYLVFVSQLYAGLNELRLTENLWQNEGEPL